MLSDGELTRDYAPPGGYDELVDGAGGMRAHWRPLLRELAALAPATRSLRTEQLNARVRETGIAHDLFSDPARAAQPWRIDLVPLLLAPQEWRGLEQALAQRARLFEALLSDLYGPQKLLKSGSVPHELIFSDPSYLRPCHGLRATGGFLQFFAADLARAPDGAWRVIDTHTETPAGLGYALANRMVHTNVAGDIFGACKALRLAPFFQQLQTSLARRAGRPDPTIALLTPGPRHNDFFSHAYLARYLGMLLVEGGDLRASAERVALKTLHGLMPIDLIVRCIAGAAADPLELDAEAAGPVGLLEPVRQYPDLITNALGSALAENRALSAYLPRLAQSLLGEELRIGDGMRWWLGDAGNRRHVLAHLDSMVIRPAHEGTARPGWATAGIDPSRLSKSKLAALLEEIEIRGATLVAEEKIGFGTTPSFTPEGLLAKPYAVRLFAAATAQGFVALPGGLAMTVDPDRAVSLSAPEGEARDVWVVSDETPPPHTSLWRPTIAAAKLPPAANDLPSRAADNLFWLGRSIERADWTMRVLRICLSRMQEDSAPRQELRASRTALEILLARDEGKPRESRQPTDARLVEGLAHQLMTTAEWHYGLPRTLDNIHRLAGLSRDRLSLEAWRTLNDFYASRRWRSDARPLAVGDALGLLDDGLRVLAAFHGLSHENMTRGFGWSFLDMGRRLSRAHDLGELLRGILGRSKPSEEETGNLLFALELADSFITYRSRYRLAPLLPLVLDLLLIDESNPRSLAFQLCALASHIDGLPQSAQGSGRIEEQRMALTLLTEMRVADVERLGRSNAEGTRTELMALLGRQIAALPQLSDVIGRRYFNLIEKDAKWVRAHSRGLA
jgi:uncharacterized circularly permuted ATP-grasp superfamily protein/uncharacterized alpha-E superfamily protein